MLPANTKNNKPPSNENPTTDWFTDKQQKRDMKKARPTNTKSACPAVTKGASSSAQTKKKQPKGKLVACGECEGCKRRACKKCMKCTGTPRKRCIKRPCSNPRREVLGENVMNLVPQLPPISWGQGAQVSSYDLPEMRNAASAPMGNAFLSFMAGTPHHQPSILLLLLKLAGCSLSHLLLTFANGARHFL